MTDLLSYRSSVADKIFKMSHRYSGEALWELVENMEKKELDYFYSLIKNKDVQMLELEVGKRIKPITI